MASVGDVDRNAGVVSLDQVGGLAVDGGDPPVLQGIGDHQVAVARGMNRHGDAGGGVELDLDVGPRPRAGRPLIAEHHHVVGHVAAAAVWGGGLLALVVTLATRRRAHLPLRAGLVAARFSVTATIGLVLATIAGVALASMRLDNVAALWTSSYGRVLLAKVAIVGVAAVLGAHNHVVVVPVLPRDADHPLGQRRLPLGLVEVVLLIVVLALTAVLVDLGARSAASPIGTAHDIIRIPVHL